MIKIHSVRRGLATNSSSSHSLILLRDGTQLRDEELNRQEFGWQYFTAATRDAKLGYLALQVYHALESQLGPEVAFHMAQIWTGGKLVPNDDGTAPHGHVDHQSAWALPPGWDGKNVDKEFIAEVRAFLERDDVAILGGNDNGGDDHPHKDTGDMTNFAWDRYGFDGARIRKDPKGFWTIMSPKGGEKIRFSFADPTQEFEVTKATYPELVDLKITDFCTAGCDYCYQGSTPKGEHAAMPVLSTVIAELGAMKVFEVALGGGEPTDHPHFEHLLELCRRYHIVPNFTTKKLDWLRDPTRAKRIAAHMGAFAYSVEEVGDIQALVTALDVAGIERSKAAVQLVMGSTPTYHLEALLRMAWANDLRVTLLGFKKTGRGATYAKRMQAYDDWIETVEGLHEKGACPALGIDTALAKGNVKRLKAMNIDSRLYEVDEGKFSMYIDAVAGLAGPSSYAPKDEMVKLDVPENVKSEQYYRMYGGVGSETIGKQLAEAFAKW